MSEQTHHSEVDHEKRAATALSTEHAGDDADQLPRSDGGRCLKCRCWLYYHRRESLQGAHWFLCRTCGRRYTAGEAEWTPGASKPASKAVAQLPAGQLDPIAARKPLLEECELGEALRRARR